MYYWSRASQLQDLKPSPLGSESSGSISGLKAETCALTLDLNFAIKNQESKKPKA